MQLEVKIQDGELQTVAIIDAPVYISACKWDSNEMSMVMSVFLESSNPITLPWESSNQSNQKWTI